MSFSDELFAASKDDQASAMELRELLGLAAIRFRAVEFEMSPSYLDLIDLLRKAIDEDLPDFDEILEDGQWEESEKKRFS